MGDLEQNQLRGPEVSSWTGTLGAPKNGEVVQHIPQPEQSHTCQHRVLKRGGFSSRISPYPNTHTDFFFFSQKPSVLLTELFRLLADQECKPTTKEIASLFQAWRVMKVMKSNSELHPEDLISAVIKVRFVKCVSCLNYHELCSQQRPLSSSFNVATRCKQPS